MSTPSKTTWHEVDDKCWFSNYPDRFFRLRRSTDKERLEETDYVEEEDEILPPTHVLVMKEAMGESCYLQKVFCRNRANGALFDSLLCSNICNTDLVYAALWGRMVFNLSPLNFDEITTLVLLEQGESVDSLECEELK